MRVGAERDLWLPSHEISSTNSKNLKIKAAFNAFSAAQVWVLIYSHSFSVYLVALVDAVDELRVRGCPGEADCGGVDGLCFHIAWSDGGNWLTGKMENRRQGWKQMRLLFLVTHFGCYTPDNWQRRFISSDFTNYKWHTAASSQPSSGILQE